MSKQNTNRMRASLPISGLDTSTPDLTVADGKCEELHNLRWETGSWHNIDPLKIKHWLTPYPGQEAFFEKLSIVYHHPAAGDDVYIASVPRDDGTVNLHQVVVENGTLRAFLDKNNPIVIQLTFGSFDDPYAANCIYLESRYPVASNVSVTFNIKDTVWDNYSTLTLTIPAGRTESQRAYSEGDKPVNNADAVAVPASDATYNYPVFSSEQDAQTIPSTFATSIPAGYKLSHFGNILILMDDRNKQVQYYFLSNGQYQKFQIPRPPVVRQAEKFTTGVSLAEPYYTKIYEYDKNNLQSGVAIYNTSTGAFCIPQTSAEYFWGEICFFAIYQMVDGSLVAPSALTIAASEPLFASQEGRQYIDAPLFSSQKIKTMSLPNLYVKKVNDEKIFGVQAVANTGDGTCTPHTFLICPHISITIPPEINRELITAVNIYSTRINPIWDAEKLKDLKETTSVSTLLTNYFADNKLPEQPFYFVKSLPLTGFIDAKTGLYLDAKLLTDLEQNSAYEPVDAHMLYYDVAKEYNSRLHIGGNLSAQLFEGYGNDYFPQTDNQPDHSILTTVRIDNKDIRVETKAYLPVKDEHLFIFNKILSYPDYRAKSICFQQSNANGTVLSASYGLDAATTNNFAYSYHKGMFDYGPNNYPYLYTKYSASYTLLRNSQKLTASNPIVPLQNKLRISAPNNPFSFPLATSYAIGTENNRILAINSAALEMSDAKFGEFPLYVFTEEGIFTMQSGSGEVLYSATIPLNYDRIVNPTTLAVNHNVLYITARGLHAMFSNESRLISEPINDMQNLPPLDYLRTAMMCYQPAHNEVIVYNPEQAAGKAAAGTRAYVYSLDGGYWSTRDLEGSKLNTPEFFVRKLPNVVLLLDLEEEAARFGERVGARIVSRPIKLESTDYKRLETFIARLRATAPQPLRLLFEGSNDLKSWFTLRNTGSVNTDRDTMVRRFPGSVRYLRITLEADVNTGIELVRFDFEYYLRFLHRLR